jgi:D-alanyl-D-alanine carboxypeptidase (penicillin-binding protein 5/6)
MKKCLFFVCIVMICTACNVYADIYGAESACLMNAVTGEVVYEKNAYDERPMASTTKIMTALVALENSDLYDIVTMSNEAVNVGGSSTYAKAGDQLYMEDALFGLMLNSGNDAAEAIAQTVGGTKEDFVKMMNERAAKIGATHTCFLNPSGLPQDGHYTTAYDLALIAREALKNDKFAEIVSTQQRTVWPVNNPERPLSFYNHNKLLDLFDDCTGVKTGYTQKAGRCLVSSAQRDGMKYIAVTLNDRNDWNDHKEMYERAFSESYPFKAVDGGQCIKKADGYSFVAEEDFIIPSPINKRTEIDLIIHMPEKINGPINKGEKVGYMQVMYNQEEIGTVNIVSESDVIGEERLEVRKSLKGYILEQLKKLMI